MEQATWHIGEWYLWQTCSEDFSFHYSDVTMGALALKSSASRLFTQPFIQTKIEENIKAPRHWPCAGNSPGTGEFPAQMASNAENTSIWWRHHVYKTILSKVWHELWSCPIDSSCWHEITLCNVAYIQHIFSIKLHSLVASCFVGFILFGMNMHLKMPSARWC